MNGKKKRSSCYLNSQPQPNPIPSFVPSPRGHPSTLRGAVFKQDIADTKAPICTIMIYTVTPKDS